MKKTLALLGALTITPLFATETAQLAAVPVRTGERLLLPAVKVPHAFKTASGKTLPAGLYDFELLGQGNDRIRIGLLKGGQRQGELIGSLKGSKSWGDPHAPQGGRSPAGSAQMGDGSVRFVSPGISPTTFQKLGFTPASKVSFGGGGGAGKISCSNNLQPGEILPYIEFSLPPAAQQAK